MDKVGVATDRRGFVPVTEKMEVVDKSGEVVEGVFCIGDANGVMMLAHAASAQVYSHDVFDLLCTSAFHAGLGLRYFKGY